MDTLIVVFRDRPHSLLHKAVCFDADDRLDALAVYAGLGPELRPIIYVAQAIEPARLAGGPVVHDAPARDGRSAA